MKQIVLSQQRGTSWKWVRERFLYHHPLLAYLFILIAFPLATLISVATIVFGVMLPISYLMGWL